MKNAIFAAMIAGFVMTSVSFADDMKKTDTTAAPAAATTTTTTTSESKMASDKPAKVKKVKKMKTEKKMEEKTPASN